MLRNHDSPKSWDPQHIKSLEDCRVVKDLWSFFIWHVLVNPKGPFLQTSERMLWAGAVGNNKYIWYAQRLVGAGAGLPFIPFSLLLCQEEGGKRSGCLGRAIFSVCSSLLHIVFLCYAFLQPYTWRLWQRREGNLAGLCCSNSQPTLGFGEAAGID